MIPPIVLLASAVATTAIACQSSPEPAPVDAPDGGPATIRFEDVTERAGIRTAGHTYGASVGDFDGDGWPDLFVGNHFHSPGAGLDVSLFRNRRDGTFEEVAERVLAGNTHGDIHGGEWVDFDDDGDQDLFVQVGADFGTGAMPKLFFVNDAASGKLVESAAQFGVDYPEGRGRTPLWLPWDSDRSLELLLANQERPDRRAPTAVFKRTDGRRFEEASVALGFQGLPNALYAQLSDLDQDGCLDLLGHEWSGPRLLSVGPAAQPSAIARIGKLPAQDLSDSAIADFDGDLLPDLFLARQGSSGDVADRLEPTRLDVSFAGDGRGRAVSFVCDSQSVDVTLSDFGHNARSTFVGARREHPDQATFPLTRSDPFAAATRKSRGTDGRILKLGFDAVLQRWRLEAASDDWWGVDVSIRSDANIRDVQSSGLLKSAVALPPKLLLHRAPAAFRDATRESGLAANLSARSVVAADFDDDGDVDLFVVQSSRTRNLPDVLFLNRGDGVFDAVPDAAGASGTKSGYGDCAVALDFDRDGFLDLFVTNGEGSGPEAMRGTNQLFRNAGNGNHWIELDLVGTKSNRDGIGASVRLMAGSRLQLREQGGGMHRFSQDSKRLHFGLGGATRVDDLWIRWPAGTLQHLRDVAADQILEVREPGVAAEVR